MPTTLEGTGAMWESWLFPVARFRIGLILTPSQLKKILTPKQREVCAAWLYDGTPQPDIAVRFDISKQAVSRLILRARNTLARHGVSMERGRAA